MGANVGDTNSQTPVWSIAIFDAEGDWGRARCCLDTIWAELYPKLRGFESQTWNEILANKQRNHSVEVGRLCKAAQDRLDELKLDDIDELFRLRLSGEARVWGIREGRVMKLLWWDPDHKICPSVLKHT